MTKQDLSIKEGKEKIDIAIQLGTISFLCDPEKQEVKRQEILELFNSLALANDLPIALLVRNEMNLAETFFVYKIPQEELSEKIRKEHKDLQEKILKEKNNGART